MAKNSDNDRKALQDKRELLKLRQGLVDEEDSEILAENPREPYEELHGMKKVENFFYHYKVPFIVILLVSLAVGYMIYDTVTKERDDLYVLAISTTNESGLYAKQFDIEKALEQYCPDFDGNGYVHVAVNFMNLSEEAGVSQYSDSEHYKFTSELFTGDSQLYLTDEGIIPLINEVANNEIQFFVDFTEEYPTAALYEGMGLQMNTTAFKDSARWTSCPDIVGLYVRNEFVDMTGNTEEAKTQRERAKIVFDNILNGNIVNPPAES